MMASASDVHLAGVAEHVDRFGVAIIEEWHKQIPAIQYTQFVCVLFAPAPGAWAASSALFS